MVQNNTSPMTGTPFQVSTADIAPAAPPPAPPAGRAIPEAGPAPDGTVPGAAPGSGTAVARDQTGGVGIEGEMVVWQASYSLRNFLGRLALGTVLLAGWIVLAIYATRTDMGGTPLEVLAVLLGLGVLLFWLSLIVRMVMARFGHRYRLTTRRLIVSTGLFRRRRDMMELLRVEDIFTRQTMFERWLSVGSVVVEAPESTLPRLYLTGVSDPKGVLDLVWHYARAERDQRSLKVENL